MSALLSQSQSKYSQALSNAKNKKVKEGAWERCVGREEMAERAQKRREGGEHHCGVQFLCNVSPCFLPPPQMCLSDRSGVRCVQQLAKLCLQTGEGGKSEK